jgi:hypothetical protein
MLSYPQYDRNPDDVISLVDHLSVDLSKLTSRKLLQMCLTPVDSLVGLPYYVNLLVGALSWKKCVASF